MDTVQLSAARSLLIAARNRLRTGEKYGSDMRDSALVCMADALKLLEEADKLWQHEAIDLLKPVLRGAIGEVSRRIKAARITLDLLLEATK